MAQIKVIQVQCTGNGNVRKTITCEWAGDWSGERELNGNMQFRERERENLQIKSLETKCLIHKENI